MTPLDIGNRILALRRDRSLSLRALADLSRTSASAISEMERGERDAALGTLARILDALDAELVIRDRRTTEDEAAALGRRVLALPTDARAMVLAVLAAGEGV